MIVKKKEKAKEKTKRELLVADLHRCIDELGANYVEELEKENKQLKKDQKEAFRLIDKYVQIVANKNRELRSHGIPRSRPVYTYRPPYKPPKGYNKFGERL